MARRVGIEIVGDTKDVERAFDRASRKASQFNREIAVQNVRLQKATVAGRGFVQGSGLFSTLGSASGAFLGGLGASKAIQASVLAASNLNEQTSKSQVIFKAASREVEAWAKTTATGFGIAEDKALEAAGTFGGLFNTVGVGAKRSAELSRSLVELAADLGSISNLPVEDALLALRSGLAGESEPLRRFNVFLSEARVQQEAFAATGKKSARELTNQEKVLARYSIILKDSAVAQGDFARTQGEFANQVKTLQAQVRNLSSDLGTLLLPVLTDVVEDMNDGIGIARDFGVEIRKIPLPPGTTEKFGRSFKDAFKQGFVPGIVLAGQLADKVQFVQDRIRALRGEVAAPFDFNSLNALGVKFQTAGLLAKDLIETQRELDRTRPPRGPNITVEQRNQFFDTKVARELDRVQDKALRDQVAALDKIADRIRDRIKVTKDITRLQTLEDDLLDILRQRKSVVQQIADNARADADAAKQAAADAKAAIRDAGQALVDALQFGLTKAQVTASFADDLAALDAINAALRKRIAAEGKTLDLQRQLFENQQQIAATRLSEVSARQFRALGLSATGDPITPGVANLKKRLAQLTENLAGTSLNTTKMKAQLARFRKVLSEGLVPRDVRAKIKEMFDDISQQIRDRTGEMKTAFQKLDTSKFVEGIEGLTAAQKKAIRARVSQIGPNGTVPGTGFGAFGVAFSGDVVVHHQTVLDGRVIESNVTRRQRRNKQANPTQRRGFAGNR